MIIRGNVAFISYREFNQSRIRTVHRWLSELPDDVKEAIVDTNHCLRIYKRRENKTWACWDYDRIHGAGMASYLFWMEARGQ